LLLHGHIVVEIRERVVVVLQFGVCHGTLQEQGRTLMRVFLFLDTFREVVNELEDLLGAHVVHLLALVASQIQTFERLHRVVELLQRSIEGLAAIDCVDIIEIRQAIGRQHSNLDSIVLDGATDIALVFMLDGLWLILHDDVVIFTDINLGASAHLLQLLAAPPLLDAHMLIHLSLEDAELIEFGLRRHTQLAIALRTLGQTRPEIGELTDNGGIVADGRTQITQLVVEQGTVIDSHEVLRLHLHHKVEVFQRAVVVTKLQAQQATVVVSQEVVWIQVDGHVIVGHCPAQVVEVESHQRTVDIVVNDFRAQIDQLAQTGVCDRPMLAVEGDG